VVKRATGTINNRTGVVTWGAYASKPAATSVLGVNLQSFVDGPTGVAANALYQYQVYAVNGTVVGPLSSTIVVTATTLAAPTQLQSGGAAATTSLALAWQNTTSALATGYEVQHCVGTAVVCAAATAVWAPVPGNMVVGATATKYTTTGLITKTTYSFRVRAINSMAPALVSPWSATLAMKTK
jgi:hypothetical protein